MTDDVSVPFLSLTETEGEELLLISKEFPPPPEGEIVDVCEGNQDLHVNISSSTIGRGQLNIFHNFKWIYTGNDCNFISLDENSQTNCEELLYFCLATKRAHERQLAIETATPHITQTVSTGTESATTYVDNSNYHNYYDYSNPSLETTTTTVTTTTTTTTTSTQPQFQTTNSGGGGPISISALPSWSLKWCPGRIGSNPNRLYSFPQCCFHPITQTPSGKLWGCLTHYRRQN